MQATPNRTCGSRKSRHAVSRRGRCAVAEGAGRAASLPAGCAVPARRLGRAQDGRCQGGGGEQCRSRSRGAGPFVPRRPLFSARRADHRTASLARATHGHSAADRFLRRAVSRCARQGGDRRWRRCAGSDGGLCRPGNIRELENIVLRVSCLPSSISSLCPSTCSAWAWLRAVRMIATAPLSIREACVRSRQRGLRKVEENYLRWLLHQTKGNISAAAKKASTERRHMGRKLRQLGIDHLTYR